MSEQIAESRRVLISAALDAVEEASIARRIRVYRAVFEFSDSAEQRAAIEKTIGLLTQAERSHQELTGLLY